MNVRGEGEWSSKFRGAIQSSLGRACRAPGQGGTGTRDSVAMPMVPPCVRAVCPRAAPLDPRLREAFGTSDTREREVPNEPLYGHCLGGNPRSSPRGDNSTPAAMISGGICGGSDAPALQPITVADATWRLRWGTSRARLGRLPSHSAGQ
jgi:hypothetical protein